MASVNSISIKVAVLDPPYMTAKKAAPGLRKISAEPKDSPPDKGLTATVTL